MGSTLVHATDSADHAALLVKRTALAEGFHGMAEKPVLYGDNGATLKATTVLAMLHRLGIKLYYSRPRVSDDNPYAEALFRTAKYRPEFPSKGFADLYAARAWAMHFVHWYNNDHHHSGIGYVTPAQRHTGQDRALPAARHEVYRQARPGRWSSQTRNWTPVGAVTLNPERDAVVQAALSQSQLSGSIGEPALLSRPGEKQAMARNGAGGKRAATRSHAQRALPREHCTFPAVSTMACSAPVGGSSLPNRPERRGGYSDSRYEFRTTTILAAPALGPVRNP